MLPLFGKVALLLMCCMLVGGVGTYVGRGIRTLGAFIGLSILFIGGAIGVFLAASAHPAIGISLLMAWTFVSGLLLGPAIAMYVERLGWQTVCLAYVGTGGVMAVCGAIGALSGINFSFLGGILFLALFGLVIFGVIGIFVRMSRQVNIVHSLIGMVVFAGYFIFDFWRLSVSENSWEAAIRLTMSLYLDFINFLLYLLQFLAETQKSSAAMIWFS